MKKIILLSVMFSSVFLGCKKAEELLPLMSAKIDGQEWNAQLTEAAVKSGKYLITGTSLKGEFISITVNKAALGDYSLNPLAGKVELSAFYKPDSKDSDSTKYYFAKSGSVSISGLTTSVTSGTFALSLIRTYTETKTITSGTFTNVLYSGLPTSAGLTASVDGVNWTADVTMGVLQDKKINITATGLNKETINITVMADATGTYTLDPLSGKTEFAAVYKPSSAADSSGWFAGKKGSVVISSINTVDKTISGTFNLEVACVHTDKKELTSGSYSNIHVLSDGSNSGSIHIGD